MPAHHPNGLDTILLRPDEGVIGMFAPGFFTGHLIKRLGTLASS